MGKGRPRKAGKRKPCGRLVQKVEANERVTAERKALMGDAKGDLSQADDPMILAFARGWLTERQLRAGEAFARYWATCTPHARSTGLSEAPDPTATVRDGRGWTEVPDAEIVALFDQMMDGTRRRELSEDRQLEARVVYNRVNRELDRTEQQQVFECFCLHSWPQWVIWQASGKEPTGIWATRKALLIHALDTIADRLTSIAIERKTFESSQSELRVKPSKVWFGKYILDGTCAPPY